MTRLFRDPGAFDALKRCVFPVIAYGRAGGSAIRIWVPGCSTGEEAYSLLIALEEYQVESGSEFPVQLFASDISESALQNQSGGAVTCESELGQGTRFTLLLPETNAAEDVTDQDHLGLTVAPGSSEVILLVEDQDAVRRLMKRVLERSGYVVLEARDGREGLSTFESNAERIALLVCDVVMPELTGGMLAEQATALRPGLKVLFVSGHTEDILVKGGVSRGAPFLQKPYSPAELARKVREVLDAT